MSTSVGNAPVGIGNRPTGNTASDNKLLGRQECGSVTAELAVGLPVIVLLLVAVLTLSAASSAQLRVLDAARAGARAVAIGQTEPEVGAVVSRLAGDDAELRFEADGQWVTVYVSKPIAPGVLANFPARVTGSATAWAEP